MNIVTRKRNFLSRFPFLKAAENRDSFFKRIEMLFPKSDYRYIQIERAYNTAKDAFRGIKREGGDRYFEHIRAVALIIIDYLRVSDFEIIIAAILHDIVEDIPSWTIERVRLEFGDRVALLVDYMTKPSKERFGSKEEVNRIYHNRFRVAPRDFFIIKLADRLHNLLTLDDCPKEKQERKIEETKIYYLPYAEQNIILFHEINEAIQILEAA